jgi:transposase
MEHQDHTATARVSVGIDVSKETLDACLMQPGKSPVYGKFNNDQKGHIQLLKWARRIAGGAALHFCMEATGAYSDACATYLAQTGQTVSVVNPYKIHHWAISKGQGNKTDKADARAIAEYCLKEVPALWRMAAPEVRELLALVRHLDNLKQHAIQQKNRLSEPGLPEPVNKSLKTLLAQIENEIANVEELIKKHINNHPRLKRDRDLLVSIPGISDATAAKLLAELPDVEQFASAKVAAKYCGLSPSQYQSGTSVWKRTRLYVAGKRRLKAALYMPAMSAIQCNAPVQRLYKRLIDNGHKGASALAAAMRKLLMIAFGVLKTQVPFQANFAETSHT